MKKFIIAAILFASCNSFSMVVDPNDPNGRIISQVSLLQIVSAHLCAQARENNENKVFEYIGRHYVWGTTDQPENVYQQRRKDANDFLKIPGTNVDFNRFLQFAKLKISEGASRDGRIDVVQFIESLQ